MRTNRITNIVRSENESRAVVGDIGLRSKISDLDAAAWMWIGNAHQRADGIRSPTVREGNLPKSAPLSTTPREMLGGSLLRAASVVLCFQIMMPALVPTAQPF